MFRRLATILVLAAAPLAAQSPKPTIPGLDAAGMDRSVRPGDNWYRYANGRWEDNTTIPADRASYGAFSIAANQADKGITAIVHGAAKAKAPAGSELRKIGDWYRAYLDTAAINQAGIAPLQPLLDSITAIQSRDDLAHFVGATLRADVDVINDGALHTDNLFGLWVDQDFNDPTRNSAALLQGGLGLPDRSYYVDSSAKMQKVRDAYQAHVEKMLSLAGIADAGAKAAAILALETKIAQTHEKAEDTWDVVKGNNHWSRADFRSKAPGFAWDTFFVAARLGDMDTLVAWQPAAIAGIAALTASEPLDAWKDLLTYHAIEHRAAVLPTAFDHEAFDFFGHTLSGAPEQQTREKRAVRSANAALGFAVGRRYVKQYFPASAKRRAQAMVAGIIAAFNARIDRLDWMAPATKAEAKRKLQTIRVSVGYPDTWPSYDSLDVSPTDAYGNAARLQRFDYANNIAKLHRPTDRAEWSMTPQTVNAVNMPAMNALNFPAAILQPPFFDADRADAMNYAGMGAVIGHEISHSFDNLGANFDADGRLRNWWTPADSTHFANATQALIDQYNAYHPFPDLAINGKLTVTENIADLAGITAAYDAWKASLHGKPAPKVGGLTGDQQFFLSFAQIWRTKTREPSLRRQILTDGHSPAPWRALTVRNLDAWYPAFDVKPGEKLYLAPDQRVRIW